MCVGVWVCGGAGVFVCGSSNIYVQQSSKSAGAALKLQLQLETAKNIAVEELRNTGYSGV